MKQQRREFLAARKGAMRPAAVESLYNAVVVFARVDLQKAERMAQASSWIAAQINDPYCYGAERPRRGPRALPDREISEGDRGIRKSAGDFPADGHDVDYARTISGALQSLIYDGQYERAFRLGEEARAIFHKHKDKLRLSRLNSNIANIYYRQDRFQEAVEVYEKAYEEFLQYGEPLDIAAVLRNLAVCYIQLERF